MPRVMEPPEAQDRSPRAEIAKRAAEGGQGLATAAFAVGLENHRMTLMDHIKRVRESHEAMKQAAGKTELAADKPKESGDDMGDIIVTGDNHYHQQSSTSQPRQDALGTLGKMAIGAALLAGGGGLGAGIASLLMKPSAPVTNVTNEGNPYELVIPADK